MKSGVVNTLGPFGGTNPSGSFDEQYTGIRQIRLRYADVINSMIIEYDDNGKSVWSSKREDSPEETINVGLALLSFGFPNEYLVSVKGTYGIFSNETVVTSLTFETNRRVFGPFGTQPGTQFSMSPPTGKIIGFYGTYGKMLNSIGVYKESYHYKIEAFGLGGTLNWDDGIYTGVKKILMHCSGSINGIMFEYDSNGKSVLSPPYGLITGKPSVLELAYPDEYLISVSGSSGLGGPSISPNVIWSLIFTSNWRTYGPFGRTPGYGTRFVFPSGGGKLLGFFGTHDLTNCIQSIGAYTEREPPSLETIGPFGGSSGNKWDDGSYDGIRNIEMFVGDCIDSFKTEYAENQNKFIWSEIHGSIISNDSKKIEVPLDYPEEFLVSVNGYYHTRSDNNVRSLTFKSNRRTYGPFGGRQQGVSFSISATNSKIIGFHGLKGTYLKAIGANLISIPDTSYPNQKPEPQFTHKSFGPFGGNGGIKWDDGVCDAIRKIEIASDEYDSGIQYVRFEYIIDGRIVISKQFGSYMSGSISKVEIDEQDEFLICVTGYYDDAIGFPSSLVQSLTFKTNKKTYGPYGREKGTKFLLGDYNTKIVGFLGSSGQYLDSIGAHVVVQ